MIKLKRAYDPPARSDGMRILVDRLWPRGLRREDVRIDMWSKDIAPSDDLRKRFHRDPDAWQAFRKRYFAELDGKSDAVAVIVKIARKRTITLVYASKEEIQNNAAALKDYLEARMAASARKHAA